MPKKTPSQILIAFVPVLHRGYIDLFNAFPEAKSLYLIDRTVFADKQIDYLRKDLRQLMVSEASAAVKGLNRFEQVEIYRDECLDLLDTSHHQIILPNEDISRLIGDKFSQAEVRYHSVFLRWDRRKLSHVNQEGSEEAVPVSNIQHLEHMNTALRLARLSTDIWRRVGAVLVVDKEVLDKAHNIAEPNDLSPWIEGDPRNAFNRGVGIEMSIFTHAEALLIARAAKYGVSLEGASLYVTDFPCPACAKLIAHSGISKVYYKDGYAVLDGRRVLDEYKVSIQRVKINDIPEEHPEVWVPYKKQ